MAPTELDQVTVGCVYPCMPRYTELEWAWPVYTDVHDTGAATASEEALSTDNVLDRSLFLLFSEFSSNCGCIEALELSDSSTEIDGTGVLSDHHQEFASLVYQLNH